MQSCRPMLAELAATTALGTEEKKTGHPKIMLFMFLFSLSPKSCFSMLFSFLK